MTFSNTNQLNSRTGFTLSINPNLFLDLVTWMARVVLIIFSFVPLLLIR